MLILAIDTALDACAAAVLDTGANRLIAVESQAMKRGHAEALMPLIARVMKEAAVPFAALDRIAVTTGPGSFTGLRVGVVGGARHCARGRTSRWSASPRCRPMPRLSSARAASSR